MRNRRLGRGERSQSALEDGGGLLGLLGVLNATGAANTAEQDYVSAQQPVSADGVTTPPRSAPEFKLAEVGKKPGFFKNVVTNWQASRDYDAAVRNALADQAALQNRYTLQKMLQDEALAEQSRQDEIERRARLYEIAARGNVDVERERLRNLNAKEEAERQQVLDVLKASGLTPEAERDYVTRVNRVALNAAEAGFGEKAARSNLGAQQAGLESSVLGTQAGAEEFMAGKQFSYGEPTKRLDLDIKRFNDDRTRTALQAARDEQDMLINQWKANQPLVVDNTIYPAGKIPTEVTTVPRSKMGMDDMWEKLAPKLGIPAVGATAPPRASNTVPNSAGPDRRQLSTGRWARRNPETGVWEAE